MFTVTLLFQFRLGVAEQYCLFTLIHLPIPVPLRSYYAFIVGLLGHTAVRTSVA